MLEKDRELLELVKSELDKLIESGQMNHDLDKFATKVGVTRRYVLRVLSLYGLKVPFKSCDSLVVAKYISTGEIPDYAPKPQQVKQSKKVGKHKVRTFSDAEKDYMRSSYKTVSVSRLAKMLKVSVNSVTRFLESENLRCVE